VIEGVEECLGPEVKGVIVGERDAVHSQERERLGGDRRGTEEERLVRVGPGHPPSGDAAFEIDDGDVRFSESGNHLVGEQGGGRRLRQDLGDARELLGGVGDDERRKVLKRIRASPSCRNETAGCGLAEPMTTRSTR
jgi:hypothetical protein